MRLSRAHAQGDGCPHNQRAVFKAVHLGDIRMVQRGEEPRLAIESGQPVGIGPEGGRQDFDGHIPAESQITREIDFAHSARAEQADNLIAADAGAGRESHAIGGRL